MQRPDFAIATLILTSAATLGLAAAAGAQITAAPDGTNTQVTPTDNTFTITGGTPAGTNLFHSFQQFGLTQGQTAHFLANANIQNILARVTGGTASVIDGQMRVSGSAANLYLMNPAGIVFGANASLNVPGSFTATTANQIGIGNGWFGAIGSNDYASLTGQPSQFAFTTPQPGTIVNAGHLAVPAGQTLLLLGGTVVNTGTLTAHGGTVAIAAVPGETLVRLTPVGSLLSLEFAPLPVGDRPDPVVSLPSPLTLPQLLTGGQVGNATGLVMENGVVKLVGSGATVLTQPGDVTIANRVDVTGQLGGTVQALGQRVHVTQAAIAASGINGGGTVLLGGDFRGAGTIPTAQRTLISANSMIRADATHQGNGGRVIVWADQITGFYGQISATGGAVSGNGGFVEVSGKENLAYQGTVTVGAPHGSNGTLLLDPRNITIQAAGADDNQLNAGVPDAASVAGEILAGDGGAVDFTVSAAVLQSQTGNVILEATNDITIANGVALSFNNTGSLVSFKADADGDGVGNFTMNPGDEMFLSGRNLAISGANLTLGTIQNAGNVTLAATGNIEVATIRADGGTVGNTVTLTAPNGSITLGTPTVEGVIQAGYMGQTGNSLISITAQQFRGVNPPNVAAPDSVDIAAGPRVSLYAYPADQAGTAPFKPGQISIQFQDQPPILSGSGGPVLVQIKLLESTRFTVGQPLAPTGSGVAGTIAIGAGFVPNALVLLQDNTFNASLAPNTGGGGAIANAPVTPTAPTLNANSASSPPPSAADPTRTADPAAPATPAVATVVEQRQTVPGQVPTCDPGNTPGSLLNVSEVVAWQGGESGTTVRSRSTSGLPPCSPSK